MKQLKELLVNIDGGGTKTIVQITTLEGKILGKEKGGPSNIASDTEESWHSVSVTLQKTLDQIGLKSSEVQLYGGGGFAGAEVPSALERFLQIAQGFENFIVKTDAYTSCLGAHQNQDGAIVTVGTATVAYAIAKGKSSKIGGWGFPQDDQGGGSWIGLQIISEMLQAMDGRKPKTYLTESLYNHLKAQGCDPMLWAVGAHPAQFGSLVPWLVHEAKGGSDEANIFLNKAAMVVSHIAESLLKGDFKGLPLCLLGGMADILLPRMDPAIQKLIVPAKGTSLDGAFYLSLEAYNTQKGRV